FKLSDGTENWPALPTRRSSDLYFASGGVRRRQCTLIWLSGDNVKAFKQCVVGVAAMLGASALQAAPQQIQVWHALDAVHKQSFRSEEHTSELQSRENLVCRLLL